MRRIIADDTFPEKIVVDFPGRKGQFDSMAFAFKEWALVCQALGSGKQSLILRKGGIAEGKGGFGFDHSEFYLFPTWYHGQIGKVRIPEAVLPVQDPELVTLSHAASVEWSGRIADLKTVRRLESLHVLTHALVEERFVYDTGTGSLGGTGINAAFVRVYRLEPAVTLPMRNEFGGCRSWIEIPGIGPSAMVSVLSDEDHARRKAIFWELLGVSR
jgi:hypothetical protein